MDYKAIYARFIESRRNNPPAEGEYFERHHILPRCMGGGDEPENLVNLSPEDHFFAHLVLAKTYGGQNWGALRLMVSRAYGCKKIQFRNHKCGMTKSKRLYGLGQRIIDKQFRREKTPGFDPAEYHFIHQDGREEVSTKFDFCLKYEFDVRNISSMVSGRKKSVGGWTTKDQFEKEGFFWGFAKGKNHFHVDNSKYTLKHKDGKLFTGTKKDLADILGVETERVSIVVRGKLNQVKGWYLPERFDEYPSKQYINSKKMPEIEIVHVSGKTLKATRPALSKIIGVSSCEMSMLINGSQKNVKGWMLPGTDPKTINLGGKPPLKISKVYGTVIHDDLGVFTGNGTEFRLQKYPDVGGATQRFVEVVKGKMKSWRGWRLPETKSWGSGSSSKKGLAA